MRGNPISGKKLNVAAGVACVFLVGYIGFLITANYRSQLKLQEASLEQLQQDAERRAITISYFYSERKNDLRQLANTLVLGMRFESQRSDRSNEAGMHERLQGASKSFAQLMDNTRLDGDPIYSRIVLLDEAGRVLVDTQQPRSGPDESSRWERFLTPQSRAAAIVLDDETSDSGAIVSGPYRFNGRYAGQLLAWVSLETVYEHLVKLTNGSSRVLYLDDAGSHFRIPRSIEFQSHFADLSRVAVQSPGKVSEVEIPNRDGGMTRVLMNRIHIEGTPLFLVSISPAEEVFGRMPNWQLSLAMVALSALIVGGIAFAWRTNARNIVLRATLETTARSKKSVEEKNRQLIKEIAERKRAEAALLESEKRYRKFFEEDISGAFITTPDGRILACNPAFAEIFGFSSVQDALQNCVDQVYPDPLERQQFLQRLESQRKLINYEREYRRIDGKVIQTTENVIGTFDASGELVEVKGFIVDNTERRKLEAQLRQSQKMEAIGTLAGGIAHDFNNILTAIIGNAEMAVYKSPEDVPIRHNLEQVLKAGNRARDLVKQILAFSRQTEQERRPLQVSLVVKEALKLLRASLPTTIEIRQSIDDRPAIVFADPTQIHQVLMNLCTNAAYAMRGTDGVLDVRLQRLDSSASSLTRDLGFQSGPCLHLSVSDTGCGMNDSTLERIFDPFFTTKGPGEGTGMGLAMVHGIVKSHGGAISVESEVDKGSSFHVFFPVLQHIVGENTQEWAFIPHGENVGRILLVDDEEPLLSAGQQMLEYLGYEVVSKQSSLEALDAFKLAPDHFSLVITDQTMPKMTGAELARNLLQIKPEVPIILCTGFSEMIDQETAKAMGVSEFVMKPYVVSELAGIVRKLLDGKSSQ